MSEQLRVLEPKELVPLEDFAFEAQRSLAMRALLRNLAVRALLRKLVFEQAFWA